MTVFLPIANIVNLIIENWVISTAVLAVFASLCIGVFKGAKYGIWAMSILLALAVTSVCAYTVYYFIRKDVEGLIKFGIAWLPTIMFLIIVVLSTLVGIHRGLRKSLILLLHAVLVAGVCLGLYFFCVTSPAVDKWLLQIINAFMGTGGLQSELGVRSDCATLREVLLEFFNGFTADMGDFGVLLQSNGAYVLTLINMLYRIAFAIVLYIVYLLLLFIMYIIYLVFYPERRYKNKRNIRFALGKTDCSYNKRAVGGGCVGLVRGLIAGLISLSFIGSMFYIAVGGTGASKLPEDFSLGEDYDPIVSIYRSIEDYGDQGIFQVLNAISNPEDTPYYLFAADIVFSGGLDDEEHQVSGNIKFREELSAYTGFAKNTLALLLKYDCNGDIKNILSGADGGGTSDKLNKILDVCVQPEFRVEFNNLIDNFNSQTYVINFALSLADSVITNIDDVSFMQTVSADNKELLQVLFKKGYLCDTIPDERERKQTAVGTVTQDIPPHLTVNHLLTKKDAQIVLDVVLSILADEVNVKEPETIARVLIPYIEDLSILSTARSGEMDPVLGRLYCYFDNKYLTDAGEEGVRYSQIKEENVSWTKEIRALLSVSDGIFTMYGKVQGSEDIFNTALSLFDRENEDYAENVRIYEELIDVVSNSKLISKALCSQKIYIYLNTQLQKTSDNVYLPRKITYENSYDDAGNLISYGEAYNLLRGLRLLCDAENKDIVDALLDGGASFEDLIRKLSETLTKPDPNAPDNSLASYFTDSVLLRSTLTSVIIDRAGDMLKVPSLSLEQDNGERVNIINKAELRGLLEALPNIVDLVLSLSTDEITGEKINDILNNTAFNALLDDGNKIAEATVAHTLLELLADADKIAVPNYLKEDGDYAQWITVDSIPGELRRFIHAVKAFDFDVGKMLDGGGFDSDKIYNELKTFTGEEIQDLLESGIFYYTASDMLDRGQFSFDGFKVVVPASACVTLTSDSLLRVIKKDELTSVFTELTNFGLTDGTDNEAIVRKLVEQKEAVEKSDIISASVVNYIVGKDAISSALKIPENYMQAGSTDNLAVYDMHNVWRKELPRMIVAIDEIFGVSAMPDGAHFSFDSNAVTEKTNALLTSFNNASSVKPGATKLDVCCDSDIIRNNFTEELDKVLNDDFIEASVRNGIKVGGVYPKQEISSLVTALNELGITDINNFDGVDFSKEINSLNNVSVTDRNKTKLEVIYKSDIVAGAITKSVKDTFADNDLVYHSSAVRSDLPVLEEREICALTTLLKGADLNDFDVGTLSLSAVREQLVPDVSGNPNSYLISANLTSTITGNGALYVPSGVYADSLINAQELLNFIDALTALRGDCNLNSWTVEDDMVVPKGNAVKTILASEIMRATFSHNVFVNENNTELLFLKESVNTGSYRVTQDGLSYNKIAVISEAQLEILFEIIQKFEQSDELKVPSFDSLEAIGRLDDGDIDLLCRLDATRYSISKVILTAMPYPDYQTADFYKFGTSGGTVTWQVSPYNVLTADAIKTIKQLIS